VVKLYDVRSEALVGEVTEDDVQFLIDQLEEEYADDVAYYVNADTLEFLRERKARPELLDVLAGAIAVQGDAELRWSPE